MPQTLRPDSNIRTTNIVGGYADIDEVTPTAVDKLYSLNGSNATYECGLSNPPNPPGSGTSTVTYIIRKRNEDANAPNSGKSVVVTCHVYEGTTLIASDTPRTLTGEGSGDTTPGLIDWWTYSFNPDMSGVTDWNNLRLRFTSSQTGSGANYGFGIAWAAMEVPDDLTHYTITVDGGSFTLSASDIQFVTDRALSLDSGAFTLSAGEWAFISGTGLAFEGGAFNLTTGDIAFRVDRVLGFGSGTFTLTGADLDFRTDYFIQVDGVSFALSMGDISFHVRELNGWNIPKYPSAQWGQAGSGGSGEWILVDPNFVNWTLQ